MENSIDQSQISPHMLTYFQDESTKIILKTCAELVEESKVTDIEKKVFYHDNCMSKFLELSKQNII